MRLTTKGRFAVTAMIDLGLRQHHGPVTLASISQRQDISLSYLEQLFGKLRRHELVASTRGPGGGYTMGRPMAEISVADVIYDEETGVGPGALVEMGVTRPLASDMRIGLRGAWSRGWISLFGRDLDPGGVQVETLVLWGR